MFYYTTHKLIIFCLISLLHIFPITVAIINSTELLNSANKEYLSSNYNTAYNLYVDLLRANTSDYTNICNILGSMHLYAEVYNQSKSFYYYNLSASLGNSKAQLRLGFMYNNNLVPMSSNTAAKALLYYYFSSLDPDNINSKLLMGFRHLYNVNNYLDFKTTENEKSCNAAAKYYQPVAQIVVDNLENFDNNNDLVIEKKRLNRHFSSSHTHSQGYNILDENVFRYFYNNAMYGNDVNAQITLGQLYYYGIIGKDDKDLGNPEDKNVNQDLTPRTENNYNKAFQFFKMASDNGDPLAMHNLGQMHLFGLGPARQDNLTAFNYFRTAAEKYKVPASFNSLGYMYLHGYVDSIITEKTKTSGSITPKSAATINRVSNIKEAVKYFTKAANLGNVDAQFNLAILYYTGLDDVVSQDIGKAIQFFTLAAQQGHTKSLFNLGQIHYYGIGIPVPSCYIAIKYYKTVAERGTWSLVLSEAYQLYQDGEYVKSLVLYGMLAEQGFEVAASNAAYLLDVEKVSWPSEFFGTGTDEESEINDIQAFKFYSLAALQGNIEALRITGDFFYYNRITTNYTNSFNLAASRYEEAAKRGDAEAAFNLGYMYANGIGLNQDYLLAKRYFDQSISFDSDAYLPSTLALWYMKLSIFYRYKILSIFNKLIFGFHTESEPIFTTEPVNDDINQKKETIEETDNKFPYNENNNQEDEDDYDETLSNELLDLLILFFTFLFGALFFIRRR